VTPHRRSPHESRLRRAICGLCSAGCWVRVGVEDGRLVHVEPDADSPYGMLCRTGRLGPAVVYAKNRLLHPMKRKGPKGGFDFERIGWDEAYRILVERLQEVREESGPEAAAVYTGSGSFELALCDVFQPKGVAVSSASSVLFPYGSPNTLGVGALCYVSFAMIAPHVTMGGLYIDMFTDIENAETIVVWGKNPAAHAPPTDFLRIRAAAQRGAKVIVIDPRRTLLAKDPGAEWIPIRPGTDGALALGLCHVLIEEELHDEAFVRDWTRGFEEFARYVRHFRPEVVERITGIPARAVVDLARRIAAARGVAPVMYSGLEYSDGAVQAIRATFVLWALAGQLDVPGGLCFAMRENRFPVHRGGHVPNPDPRKAAGHNDFPVYTKYRGEFHAGVLPRAVLQGEPYRIRLLISLGASIIASWPRSDLWEKTLAGLDFFACIDRQLTADAAWADLVLPAATYYEIQSYMVYGNAFRIRERVIEPLGEARNDFLIMAELARRLGYGHLYPQDEEEILRHALRGSGFSLEEVRRNGGMVRSPTVLMEYRKWRKGGLRADGRPGFETPTGKFEIASTVLEEYGYDALPVYTEPAESPLSRPDLAEDFPLVFNSGARSTADLHGLHQTVPELRKEKPLPTVMIHPADAGPRGIADGDRVRLSTARGSVEMFARVTEDIVPGAIEASAMGGLPDAPEEWRKANVNRLTDLRRYDPISGFPVYKALLCQVGKLASAGRRPAAEAEGYESPPPAAAVRRERIYLDHNATTPPDPEVREAMMEALEVFGNPSALYDEGRRAQRLLEDARRRVALLLGCPARRVVFTGGGSEANNLAIRGVVFREPGKRHLVTSAIEHPSVLETCRRLEEQGFRVSYVRPGADGRIDPRRVAEAIGEETALVSVMLANNETGVLQPIAEIAAAARARGVPVHTDAVQAAGKIPLDVEALGVDLLTLSAHKFHGPKGVGALYRRRGLELSPLVSGGGQEQGLRAGTENLPGIAGLGRAAERALAALPDMERVRSLRDRLEERIRAVWPEARRNGHETERLPNTLNLTIPGVRGESLVLALDQRGISCASGSACRSGDPAPSSTLLAMGRSEEEAHCALRLSLGHGNTGAEIEEAGRIFREIAGSEGGLIRFVSCR